MYSFFEEMNENYVFSSCLAGRRRPECGLYIKQYQLQSENHRCAFYRCAFYICDMPDVTLQNSITATETVKVEQNIAEEERLLYDQSDLRIEVVELTRLAAIKVSLTI